MKKDVYNHAEKWQKWKAEAYKNGIQGIKKTNSDIILQYLKDIELGLNVSQMSTKGPREPIRLNTLKDRMIFFTKHFEQRFKLNKITSLTEEQLFQFFSNIQSGKIRTYTGKKYKSIDTLSKVFKTFWHWHERASKRNGNNVVDITAYLDNYKRKPDWVYLDETQVKILLDASKFDYKVIFAFLIDTGVRPPLELVNLKVSDIYNDGMQIHVRIFKKRSFPRRIKLMLSSELLKEYIQVKNLNKDDYIFDIKPYTVNKYLKTIAVRLFGDKETLGGKKISEISFYDLRHLSCCYWLPRYPRESALKYRFGWTKSNMIHYHTELLGMKDTIAEEDLLIDVTKTELEKQLVKVQKDKTLMEEKMEMMNKLLLELQSEVKSIKLEVLN